jgi:RNA polymerase sigma factor (sigma-70 family)
MTARQSRRQLEPAGFAEVGDGAARNRPLQPTALMTVAGAERAVALEQLLDDHVGLAYSLAVRICGKPDLAETAVRDAFASLCNCDAPATIGRPGRPPHPDRGSDDDAGAWLLATVRMRAIALRRAAVATGATRGRPSRDNRRLAWPPWPPRPPGKAQAGASNAALEALDRLPADCRRALELVYFDGAGEQEIADELGVSRPCVRRMLSVALHEFGRALGAGTAGLPVSARASASRG